MSIKPMITLPSVYPSLFESRTNGTSALSLLAGSQSVLSNQVWNRFLFGLQSLAAQYPAQAGVVGGLKWFPVELAGRLRCLQHGALAVGTPGQCAANLKTLAAAEVASPTTGWARANPSSGKIQVYVPAVPGFVPYVGTNI